MKKLLIATTILTAVCYALAPATAIGRMGFSPGGPTAKDERAGIRITNYTTGTIIRHPVPLIRGTLADTKATSVTVINTSSSRNTRKIEGLARKGSFKVLTELVPGTNKLIIRAGKDDLALTLNYKPQTNPYVVLVFYLTDKTGSTEYQSPVENDPQNYRDKLATAMILMQTFTAERMYDLGFGRITFNLELDDAGRVIVHTLQAEDTAEHYHKMDGLSLWNYTAGLIRRKYPNRKAKNLVVPAFTRFDPNTNKSYAHTALGGGSLALFGGANLFTWPSSLADVQKTFMDTTTIDTTRFFSDSLGRYTFWATASTTIGAALHELGHTFGLPHSRLPHDIMTRGFDRFNRAFTLIEPPHARRKEPYEFNETQIARWAPPSAAWLKFNRWFALDKKDFSEQNKTTVTIDDDSRTLGVASDNGIGAIILAGKSGAEAHIPIDYNDSPPRKVSISIAEFEKHLNAEKAQIRVIDAHGLTKIVPAADLIARSFVRSWRFASVTTSWNDRKSFVPIDEKRLQAIAASAASAKLSKSETNYVDFLHHFTDGPRENIAAYAVRTFTNDKHRYIRIFTGSDDALRLWLNGKLITEALALRSAVADTESNTARLIPGENTLIAEVSQAGGGWGLYLRIADKNGSNLVLTEDGKITELTSSQTQGR